MPGSCSALLGVSNHALLPNNNSDALLAFSRDGKLLAQSQLDGSILILDAATGQLRRVLATGAGITSLASAPDGTLATGTPNGTVKLWNPNNGEQIATPLLVGSDPVASITFAPSGQLFATAGLREGTVKLWSTSTLQQEGAALNTDQGGTSTAAFTPDGKNLLVVDDHGNSFSWPTSVAAWEHQACTVAGRNLTRQEWARLIPRTPYQTSCP